MLRRIVPITACICVLLSACPPTDGRAQEPRTGGTANPAASGAVSPRNANYRIEVRLDHAARTLYGRERIIWRNIASRPTSELQFHLYWNAWRNEQSTWLRERRLGGTRIVPRGDAWGWIDIQAIRHIFSREPERARDLTAQMRYIAPDDGNPHDRTVATVPVPAVAPGAEIEIEIEWTARIPRPFARTGYIDDYYFIAHWFPKIGVLEDTGWNTHQFHSATEFYADYGTYDVSITVPSRFIVGATGAAEAPVATGSTVMYRFRATDVADFAWTASPHFVDTSRRFEHPALPAVTMRLLLQPEHLGQAERHFAAAAAALAYFGEWFTPYPYGRLTIVDPAYQSSSGGMEYPMLFTAGTRWLAPRAVAVPESVIIHETGHQFFYGLVGSNEFEHAWLDEGLTTYATARVLETIGHPNRLGLRYFGGFIPWVIDDIRLSRATDGNRLTTYRAAAEADVPATPTYQYWPGTATAITYDKTALWLHTLERHLGWPVVRDILRTYAERWKFRHPGPDDFFRIANEVSGQDLTWFFDQVHRSSNVFDYGIQELTSEPLTQESGGGTFRTVVVARRYGEATFPVDIVTTFADGQQARERWNGLDRRAIFVYERPTRASSAQVDPERVLLLDVNYTNNSVTLESRAREAGLKWALKWAAWAQDLLLTYGFFL